MDNMYVLMDLLFAACGVYVLYAFYLMKAKGEIKESILMSRDTSFARCRDKEGYIKYMQPKLLIFGLVLLVVGAVSFIGDYFKLMGLGSIVVLALGLIAIIWFMVITKKSMKMFW